MSGMSLLSTNGYEFTATEDERYDFVNEIAKGNLDFDAILNWLRTNTTIELSF